MRFWHEGSNMVTITKGPVIFWDIFCVGFWTISFGYTHNSLQHVILELAAIQGFDSHNPWDNLVKCILWKTVMGDYQGDQTVSCVHNIIIKWLESHRKAQLMSKWFELTSLYLPRVLSIVIMRVVCDSERRHAVLINWGTRQLQC